MTKKILTISAVVLLIILLGLAYYFFFVQPVSNTPTSQNTSSDNLFPFGQGAATTDQGQTTTNTDDIQTGVSDYLSKLRLISNEPVAGATFVQNPKGLYIRYIEKATGHIFDTATNSSYKNEISNTTIPRIHEAFFADAGQSVLARYIDDDGETIQTVYAKIAPVNSTTSVQTIVGSLLPSNIQSMSISPSSKNIFYLTASQTSSTGIISLPNNTNKKQIWNSKIISLIPQFAGDTQIVLTTKPNTAVSGFAYIINTNTGSVKNILANIPDLSVLSSPKGDVMIFYTSKQGGGLFTHTLSSGINTQISPTTFPEKCVFDSSLKDTMYCAVPKGFINTTPLDDWYLGLNSYSDDIWKYDLKNNTSTMIEDLELNANRAIDAINLQLNSAGSILLFTSKTDGSLWSLNVSQ